MKNRNHQVQISIEIKRPLYHTVTREILIQALHHRATIGEDPPGITIRMIEWNVGKVHHHYEGQDVTDALNAMYRMGLQSQFQKVRES